MTRAETLSVPSDFSTIQSAIDAAEESDVVLVEPGRYSENLILRSGVDVAGRETARTLLAPDDASLPTVTIEGVLGTRFSNFTLIESIVAVAVRQSSGVDVANIVFDQAGDVGLSIDGSAIEAINNVFYRNDAAISRVGAAAEIVNNIFFGNATAIFGAGIGDPFQNVRTNCYFENEGSPGDTAATGGAGSTFGHPRFVDPSARDFHLGEGSACIDVGRGLDSIDSTTADAGVYGGELADPFPFPVGQPSLSAGGDPGSPGIVVSWPANLSYRVTSSTNPGGYRLYYRRGEPAGDAPSDYDGVEASAGPSPLEVGNVTRYTLEDLDAAVEPPLAPRLVSAEGRNAAAILQWEAVEGADAYRIYYGIDDPSENSVLVEDGTQHIVSGLENGGTYRVAVSALARAVYFVAVTALDNTPARHESALSEPASLALGEDAESALSQVLTVTPGLIEAYPPLADGDECFIATAAFGSRHAADVEVLRAFRDELLSAHAPGRWLVGRYYASSPPAARWLDAHEEWKPVVRMLLKPFVIAALVLLEGGPVGIGAVVVLSCAGAACFVSRQRWERRRRKSEHGECDGGARRIPGTYSGGEAAAVVIVIVLAQLMAGPTNADPSASAATSPRWMYELKGGYFYPDLDDYGEFYGDGRDTYFSVSGAYRLRDWLEIGARIAYHRDRGLGRTVDGEEILDAVTQELMPLHVFADFIFERPSRRWVPYAGIGLGGALYRQEVTLQPDRDGRTDLGVFARAGVRWRFASTGMRESAERPRGAMYTRSYVFVELERFAGDVHGAAAEVDRVELGGKAWLIGVRFEFEL